MKPLLYLGSDHNGNAARAFLLKNLRHTGHDVVDCGPTEEQGKVDYPLIAEDVCHRVLDAQAAKLECFGVLVCGTGTGMCIAANKVPGIRAGLATDAATAELMREHNDANVLVLGQWRSSLSSMLEMVYAFVEAEFQHGRHTARVKMLKHMEEYGGYT